MAEIGDKGLSKIEPPRLRKPTSLEWQEIQKIRQDFNQLLEKNQSLEKQLEQQKSILNRSLQKSLTVEDLESLLSALIERRNNLEGSCSSELTSQGLQTRSQLVFNRSNSRNMLEEALDNAESRLILVCPWLTSWATKIVIDRAEELITRGVQIDIGWGSLEHLAKEETNDSLWYGALPKLRELEDRYKEKFRLKELGTHEKFLVCEGKRTFAMLGSHNFLTSNSGSPEFEVGVRLEDPRIVQELISHFDSARFDLEAARKYLSNSSSNPDYIGTPVEIELIEQRIKVLKEMAPSPQAYPSITIKTGDEVTLITLDDNSPSINEPSNVLENLSSPSENKPKPKKTSLITEVTPIEDTANEPKLTNLPKPIIVGHGEILVTLKWSQGQNQSNDQNNHIDLDLGCLYELKCGEKGSLQALGKMFGNFQDLPYIFLSGDDRVGTTGESLKINGSKVSLFKRILIYSYIYEGVSKWSEADGRIQIILKDILKQPDVIAKIDSPIDSNRTCAIALFKNVNNQFEVSKPLTYFPGQEEMDKHFSWGLPWSTGSKD